MWAKASEKLKKRLLDREGQRPKSVEVKVRKILEDVRLDGDRAVFKYCRKFDRARINSGNVKVKPQEIREAYSQLNSAEISCIKAAAKNIRKFQTALKPGKLAVRMGKGIAIEVVPKPIERAGVYVPAGRFPLPSSALMNIIPAKVAGCERVIVCTPPQKDGKAAASILVAADIAGADEIYKVGGAQAVAAMAYGTKSIPKADIIVGPGNIFVSTAKRLVFGKVGIDLIAGPTELVIFAEKGKPKFIAADILSEAEHDKDAAVLFITTNAGLAKEVGAEVAEQLKILPTAETAIESLRKNCAIIIAKNENEALQIINEFAPEHLELQAGRKFVEKVRNVGTIFLGKYSVGAAGDYASGPNHVLPTNGFAKVRAGLSVMDFLKFPAVQRISKKGLKNLARIILPFAKMEGLYGHYNSVKIRVEKRTKGSGTI